MEPRVHMVVSTITGDQFWAVTHANGMVIYITEAGARAGASLGQWFLDTLPDADPARFSEVSK